MMRVIVTVGDEEVYSLEPITPEQEAAWDEYDRLRYLRDVPEELYARWQRIEEEWQAVQRELCDIRHTYPPVEPKRPLVVPH